jgi:murein DD-endopeptidase MepM/ murein hydrolase activator NlpD
MAPRTRYAMVVTTAVVGAGVVAFGAGSALPQQQTDGANAALDRASAAQQDSPESAADIAANQTRTTSLGRASRAQNRPGTPQPEIIPEWIRPAVGPLSSLYAARWGTFHYGDDIAAPYGSTVRAASAGTVIMADWYGGYGKIVIIDHGNGITTRYGHNSKLLVKVGQHVDAGTPISLVGSTGYSTGAHCHFEVRRDGKPIDPMPFMEARGVKMATSVDTSR